MISARVPSSLLASRIANDIVQQQNALAEVQEQISTGKKVLRPSDAPAAAAHLLTMKETISRLDQYTKNTSIAESQLSLAEGALAGTTEVLNRIRDLALRANNGLVNETSRQETNAEVKLKLEELYSLANSRDSFGNYLFSGSNIAQQPFSANKPGEYAGSDETTKLEISLGRTIDTRDPGIDVFMRIRGGNGEFQVSPDMANVGTGTISAGAVTDSTIFQANEYMISFTSPNSYDIIDVTSMTTIRAGETYMSGDDINFNGFTTSISGTPGATDKFHVKPSSYTDIFSSVKKMVDALDANPLTAGESTRMNADINASITEIDNALNHVNTARARVGTRLSSIDSSRDENENIALQIERTKRDVEDVDIADAVTRLQMQTNSLEILQKSFVRIEGLSLFNYM